MKKISEYKDEEALDLLAEILEPVTAIMSDKLIKQEMKSGNRAAAVAQAIKRHKSEVIAILAAMDGVPVNEYHCDVFTLPIRALEIMNDKGLVSFFSSQGLATSRQKSSGPVTENTGENVQ